MDVATSQAPRRATPRTARDEPSAEVLRRAAAGDATASRALVERFEGTVHRFVWRMLGSRATPAGTEELVQDAFLRMFRSLPRFDPHGPARFSTWLLTITSRTVIDELRRKRPRLAPLDTPLPDPNEALRPDQAWERRKLGNSIAAAVDDLSPELRATFVLRAYHERGYAEIAEALEVDIGTVKSRIFRARRALMAALKEVRHEA